MNTIRGFRDFVNDRGENVILDWLNGLSNKKAKVRINTVISRLELMDNLELPHARMLRGSCDGLIELRIPCDGVQYRPLCCYGPGPNDVTLLIGAIEKGSKFEPKSACAIALERKRSVALAGSTTDHDFS